MSVTIKIVGLVGGGHTPVDGQYLVEYDPNRDGVDAWGNAMLAHIVASPDREDALLFPSVLEAHQCWARVDERDPVRPDGKPNRPLTAFTIAVEPVLV